MKRQAEAQRQRQQPVADQRNPHRPAVILQAAQGAQGGGLQTIGHLHGRHDHEHRHGDSDDLRVVAHGLGDTPAEQRQQQGAGNHPGCHAGERGAADGVDPRIFTAPLSLADTDAHRSGHAQRQHVQQRADRLHDLVGSQRRRAQPSQHPGGDHHRTGFGQVTQAQRPALVQQCAPGQLLSACRAPIDRQRRRQPPVGECQQHCQGFGQYAGNAGARQPQRRQAEMAMDQGIAQGNVEHHGAHHDRHCHPRPANGFQYVLEHHRQAERDQEHSHCLPIRREQLLIRQRYARPLQQRQEGEHGQAAQDTCQQPVAQAGAQRSRHGSGVTGTEGMPHAHAEGGEHAVQASMEDQAGTGGERYTGQHHRPERSEHQRIGQADQLTGRKAEHQGQGQTQQGGELIQPSGFAALKRCRHDTNLYLHTLRMLIVVNYIRNVC